MNRGLKLVLGLAYVAAILLVFVPPYLARRLGPKSAIQQWTEDMARSAKKAPPETQRLPEKFVETYFVRFLSRDEEELAHGTIGLRATLPNSGKRLGRYQLSFAHAARTQEEIIWFYELFEHAGREEIEPESHTDTDWQKEGEVEWTVGEDESGRSVHDLNFMPGLADANVLASAFSTKDGDAEGSWTYTIFSGGFAGGRLSLFK